MGIVNRMVVDGQGVILDCSDWDYICFDYGDWRRRLSIMKTKKRETKHQIIISYLNNLKWFQERKEGEDYILFYKPRRGWLYRTIINGNFDETYFLGKNFAEIKKYFEKALFAWQVFGGNVELINIKKVA